MPGITTSSDAATGKSSTVVIDLNAQRASGRRSPARPAGEALEVVGGADFGQATSRTFALLRVVAAGRAELTCSRVPDLFIDGLSCCNQDTVHELVRDGLIRQARPGLHGQRVRAQLTMAGRALLDFCTHPVSA
jgi:hypothetical protein